MGNRAGSHRDVVQADVGMQGCDVLGQLDHRRPGVLHLVLPGLGLHVQHFLHQGIHQNSTSPLPDIGSRRTHPTTYRGKQ